MRKKLWLWGALVSSVVMLLISCGGLHARSFVGLSSDEQHRLVQVLADALETDGKTTKSKWNVKDKKSLLKVVENYLEGTSRASRDDAYSSQAQGLGLVTGCGADFTHCCSLLTNAVESLKTLIGAPGIDCCGNPTSVVDCADRDCSELTTVFDLLMCICQRVSTETSCTDSVVADVCACVSAAAASTTEAIESALEATAESLESAICACAGGGGGGSCNIESIISGVCSCVDVAATETQSAVCVCVSESTADIEAAIDAATVSIESAIEAAAESIQSAVCECAGGGDSCNIESIISGVCSCVDVAATETQSAVCVCVSESTADIEVAIDAATVSIESAIDAATTETQSAVCVCVSESTADIEVAIDAATVSIESVIDAAATETQSAVCVCVSESTADIEVAIDAATVSIESAIDAAATETQSAVCVCVSESTADIEVAIDAATVSIESAIDAAALAIESAVCECAGGGGCTVTKVFDTGAQTLTEPGLYCLAEDITLGTITIAGPSITLDLNSFAVRVPTNDAAIDIVSGAHDVSVQNGSIEGQTDTDGSTSINIGIRIMPTSDGPMYNISVNDVSASNCNIGISIQEYFIENVTVDRFFMYNMLDRAIYVFNAANVVIANGVFRNNQKDIIVEESTTITIQSCVCSSGINSIGVNDGAIEVIASTNIEINDSSVTEKPLSGFVVSGGADVVLRNCVASTNAYNGFVALGTNPIFIFNCVASTNAGIGITCENDGSSRSMGVVRDCVANSNVQTGFNLQNSSAVEFYSNSACDNGTNYFGIDPALITSAANARGVHNVDCTNTTPDEVEEILAIVDGLASPCAAIPLSNASDLTLTSTGVYCLTENINSTITIANSSITLDLNGYTILQTSGGAGIFISIANLQDITIKNGSLVGSAGGDYGILANSLVTNLRVQGLNFTGFSSGITIFDSFNIFIDSVIMNEVTIGIFFAGVKGALISNSSFTTDVVSGIAHILFSVAGPSESVRVEHCVMRGATPGVTVDRGANIQIIDCSEDGGNPVGFTAGAQASSVTFQNCVASGGPVGFVVATGSSGVELLDCIANNTTTRGFEVQAGTTGVVGNCIAQNGTGDGFNNLSADVQFYNNSACNNVTNFAGDFSAPVTSPANARGVHNVDCSDTTPDQVGVIESIVENISSVVDGIQAGSPPCAAKPLSNDSTLTLTEPGIYCLTENIFSTISIASDSVTIDLNGYTIDMQDTDGSPGILLSGALRNITIHNGSLNCANPSGSQYAITDSFSPLRNIRIENVNFNGWDSAVNLSTGHNVVIDNVIVNEADYYGITIVNGSDIVVTNSVFDNRDTASQSSLYIANSNTVRIEHCIVRGLGDGTGIRLGSGINIEVVGCFVSNRNIGFSIEEAFQNGIVLRDCRAEICNIAGFSISQISNSQLLNCVASSNTGAGFAFDNSNQLSISGCTALGNNAGGFTLSGINNLLLSHSTALNNSSIAGVNIAGGCTGAVIDCVANGNVAGGFSNASGTDVQFYNNSACDNAAGNYLGTFDATVTSSANARGVHNVDCSNTDPDQVEVIESIVENISSVVDGLQVGSSPCAAIPLSNASDLTLTGTGTGVYCLTENITSPITIAGGGITLDLNGYAVQLASGNGISVTQGIQDITIRNGSLDGTGGGNQGIVVATLVKNLRIEDVNFAGWTTGILLNGQFPDGIFNVIIENIAMNEIPTGISCAAIKGAIISNSTFTVNTATGNSDILIGGTGLSEAVRIENCVMRGTTGSGSGITIDNSRDVQIIDCSVQAKSGGFEAGSQGRYVTFQNCSASDVGIGFQVGSRGIELLNCIANDATSNGFFITAGATGVVRDCVAQNGATGFNNQATGVQFYNNSACNNSLNFTGVLDAPVTSPENARGVHNVDCADTTPDQVVVIESIVQNISSVVDTLSSSPCAATPITNTLADLSLTTTGGTYCLTENISAGTLNISGSNITLDLNGYVISSPGGISISGAAREIHIKNGCLDGLAVGNNAITVAFGVEGLYIQDLVIKRWNQRGISLDGTRKVVIDRVAISDTVGAPGVGILATSSSEIANELVISNSVFKRNLVDIYLLNVVGASIENCLFDGATGASLNTPTGTGVLIQTNSRCIEIVNCTATLKSNGFLFSDCTEIEMRECSAARCGQGFEILQASSFSSVRDFNFINCSAQLSADTGFRLLATGSNVEITNIAYINCICSRSGANGFLIYPAGGTDCRCSNIVLQSCTSIGNTDDGFSFNLGNPAQNSTTGVVRDCIGNGNGGVGFNNGPSGTPLSSAQFYRNSACNNGTNFSTGVTDAPFTTAILATGWQNVSC